MRAAWTLTTACAIFVLERAASTTAGGDPTDRRALNLVTGPSRHEANASVAPSLLEAHDSASTINSIDHGLSNDEERLGVEVLPEAVEGIGTMLHPFVKHASEALAETGVQLRHPPEALAESGVQLRHPPDDHEVKLEGLPAQPLTAFVETGDQEGHLLAALEKIDVGVERKWRVVGPELLLWIQRADRYHSPSHTFGDTAIVDSLVTKFGGDSRRLVDFFHWLSVFSARKDRVIKLQRVLRDKLSLEVITPLWKESSISIDDVYHMMPIGEQPRPRSDAEAEAAWPDILANSIHWLEYVEGRRTVFARHVKAFNVLVKFRGEEEVLRLSTDLMSTDMKRYADAFQVKLYDEFTDMRPRLIDIWLESGTTPLEALDLMSITRGLAGWTENKEQLIALRVTAWIRFNDEFMARSLLFSSDEGKIKLRNELRSAIHTVPKDGATAAQEEKKKKAVETLLEDKAISMLMKVKPLASMSTDEALVTLLKDETKAKQAMDEAIESHLTGGHPPSDGVRLFYSIREGGAA